MNRIIITQLNDIVFFLVYEDDELVECHPLVAADNNRVQIGNIYLGRVSKKLKNIDAAFVSLDGDNIGYLPLDEKPAFILNRKLPNGLKSIAENDLVLVQVVNEPQKMKQALVTGNISLSGKYIALDLNEGSIGVSKRIKDDKIVKHLKELIDCDKFPYGLIYRTACENASDDKISAEYDFLSSEIESLISKASYERKTGLLYGDKPEYITLIESYGIDRILEIKTDISDIYNEIIRYFDDRDIPYDNTQENEFVKKSVSDDCKQADSVIKLSQYDDKDYPYSKLLGLEAEIGKILNKKVWLKSGGFLVIEPTEAMVVIDVNTGKAINKKNRESHILKINIEAAYEIAKQIRLRNLSGIIMVDFINMESEDSKNQVVSVLKKEFSKDKIGTHFIDITKLDVFEITRKKQRKPIYEIIQYKDNMLCKK